MKLYGFGQFRDLQFACEPGLNLILGPNEAGKSTLMAFIRAMFYGFPSKKQMPQRYEPWEGSTFGGALWLQDESRGSIMLERIYKQRSAGDVVLHFSDGTVGGEAELTQLLAPISETLYKNIHAFGLQELQSIETLQPEEIHTFLYHSTAGNGAQMLKLKQALQREAEELYKGNRKQTRLMKCRKALQQVEMEIGELQKEELQYEQLLAQEGEIVEKRHGLHGRLAQLNQALRWFSLLEQGQEAYTQLCLVNEGLQRLPSTISFPTHGLEHLERLLEKKGEIRLRLATCRNRIETGRKHLATLQVAPGWRQALQQQDELTRGWIRAQERRERKKEEEERRLQTEKQLEEMAQGLGPDWSVERIMKANPSLPARQWMKEWQEQGKQVGEEEVQLRTLYRHTEQNLERVRQQLAQAEKQDLHLLEQERTRLKGALQRAQQLALQLERKAGEQELLVQELRFESEAWRPLQLGKRFPVSLLLFDLSALGLGLYLLIGEQWTGAMLALLGAIAASGGYAYQRRRVARQMEAWQQRQRQRSSQLAEAEERCLQELERLRSEERSLFQAYGVDSLLQLEERLEAVQQQYQQEQQLKLERTKLQLEQTRLEAEFTSLQRRRAELQQRQQELAQEWQDWLQRHQLPQNWSVLMVDELIRIGDQLRPLIHKRDEVEQGLLQLNATNEQWLARLGKRMQLTGLELEESLPDWSVVQSWFQQLKEEERRLREQEKWVAQLEEWCEEERVLARELESIQAELNRLYQEVGVSSEEEYRQRAQQVEQREALLQAERTQQLILRQLVTTDEQYEELLQDFGHISVEERMEEEASLQQELQAVQRQLEELQRESGEVAQQLKRLATSTRLSQALQKKEGIRAECGRVLRQWCKLRLGQLAIEQAMELYEQEKQPAVLRWASHYFSMMTEGNYRKVFLPFEGESICVERQDGRKIEPSYLSRGTVEQLYLAIRFALVEMYGEERRLPLVFDDILVNFDPERSRKTLQAIGQLAEKQQIFFFTCHPSLVELVKASQIPAHLFQLAAPELSPLILSS